MICCIFDGKVAKTRERVSRTLHFFSYSFVTLYVEFLNIFLASSGGRPGSVCPVSAPEFKFHAGRAALGRSKE